MSEARDKHFQILFSLNEYFGFDGSSSHYLTLYREGLSQITKENIVISRHLQKCKIFFLVTNVGTNFELGEV